VSRNASTTEPAKLLAVFVADTDDKADLVTSGRDLDATASATGSYASHPHRCGIDLRGITSER
jgi:hypothetical protein